MAYTERARTKISPDGVQVDNITTATGETGGAGTGSKFQNNGQAILYINNTGVGSPSVVILMSANYKGELTGSNKTIALGSGEQHVAGVFPVDIYNDADGFVRVYFTGGDETDVELVWMNIV